jgi:hypothetical protein
MAYKYQQRLDLEDALAALDHSRNVCDNSRAYFFLVEAISVLMGIKKDMEKVLFRKGGKEDA